CLIKNKKISKKDIFEIYKNKTANYTFIAPLQIGAILAGANKLLLREIESFAMPLGIAFQIKDDVLDIKLDKKSLIDKNSQRVAKELVNKSKKIILKGKFPKEQKEFLSNLADFIIERND
ncbi:MAG: polyprenyl synthetase family protein, partial [Candidatus Nealsonbacteria bacterium]